MHDSRLFIGCAGSILVHINYWWGWEEGSQGGCGSHASQAGSFEPGMQLCEPAVHIMVAVSQSSPTEWGCWCDYRFSHEYQQHLWKTCIWAARWWWKHAYWTGFITGQTAGPASSSDLFWIRQHENVFNITPDTRNLHRQTDRQTGTSWMLRWLSLLLCGMFFLPGKPFQCFTQIKTQLILSLFRNLMTSK